jgi:hypothetical protein
LDGGYHNVVSGDWVVLLDNGKRMILKPSEFEKWYEPVVPPVTPNEINP